LEAEIPEDVMQLADAVAGKVYNAYHDDEGVLRLGKPAAIVARAILAEREKCAGIAARHDGGWVGNDWSGGYNRAAQEVAAAIRKGA
jgi:hypothetical protein